MGSRLTRTTVALLAVLAGVLPAAGCRGRDRRRLQRQRRRQLPGRHDRAPCAHGRGRRARRGSALAPPAPEGAVMAGPSIFTGYGFDACTAPSSRSMRAWRESSPFEAVGVYIGGRNRGCTQPNLTATWVGEQVANGWHLIPLYVGLQATTSSCTSCATLNSSFAAVQGEAEAEDAVSDAQAIGIGPGSPIYHDMESYTRTATATGSTMTFLAAWTQRLHELGYASGVYSSSASGIADLAHRWGTSFTSPDDIWSANWNGRADTDDPNLSSEDWPNHQRIHQYRGGHDEVWGGVRINIDSNYVDAMTVGTTIPTERRAAAVDDLARLGIGADAPGQGPLRLDAGPRLPRPDPAPHQRAHDPRVAGAAAFLRAAENRRGGADLQAAGRQHPHLHRCPRRPRATPAGPPWTPASAATGRDPRCSQDPGCPLPLATARSPPPRRRHRRRRGRSRSGSGSFASR